MASVITDLPSCRALLPLGQYQIILLMTDAHLYEGLDESCTKSCMHTCHSSMCILHYILALLKFMCM